MTPSASVHRIPCMFLPPLFIQYGTSSPSFTSGSYVTHCSPLGGIGSLRLTGEDEPINPHFPPQEWENPQPPSTVTEIWACPYAVLTLTCWAAWLGCDELIMDLCVCLCGYENMSVGWSELSRVHLGFLSPFPLLTPQNMHMHLLAACCCSELHVCVCCCGLLGAEPLPRLLMLYLLLIRMSRLRPAICTSWLAKPLPTVWCWRGAPRCSHDGVPAPDLKRPFCFVDFFWGGGGNPDVFICSLAGLWGT